MNLLLLSRPPQNLLDYVKPPTNVTGDDEALIGWLPGILKQRLNVHIEDCFLDTIKRLESQIDANDYIVQLLPAADSTTRGSFFLEFSPKAEPVWVRAELQKEDLEGKTVEFRFWAGLKPPRKLVEGNGTFAVVQRPDGLMRIDIVVNEQGRTWAERTVTRFFIPQEGVAHIRKNPPEAPFAYSLVTEQN